jgi:hypothetical protein
VGNPTDVPELEEDEAAAGVDGVGDEPPTGDLLFGVNAWSLGIALTFGADLGGLGDEESAGAGALSVVLGVERVGDVAGEARAHAGQGGEDHSVIEGPGAELKGLEERFVVRDRHGRLRSKESRSEENNGLFQERRLVGQEIFVGRWSSWSGSESIRG